MKFFLRMKHWELFLMIALPTALCFLLQFEFTTQLIAVIVLFVMIAGFSWLFSIGNWANQHLPEKFQKNMLVYALSLATPVIYLAMVILLYFPLLVSDTPPSPPTWMLPFHMLSIAGIYYGIWMTSRQYIALQRGQNDEFIIFSSSFLLMWIFPLGLWIIQPEVNQLFDKLDQQTNSNTEA